MRQRQDFRERGEFEAESLAVDRRHQHPQRGGGLAGRSGAGRKLGGPAAKNGLAPRRVDQRRLRQRMLALAQPLLDFVPVDASLTALHGNLASSQWA